MGKLHRWVWVLIVVALMSCVSCSSEPVCPTCPVLDYHIKIDKNSIIKSEADKPKSGTYWGRVELVLEPAKIGDWKLPNDPSKYKVDPNAKQNDSLGWSYLSSFNDSNGTEVRLTGKLQDKQIIVETINVNVWLDKSNVNSLTSDKGLKMRLRLDLTPSKSALSYSVRGYIRKITKVEGNNSDVCVVRFLPESKRFAAPGAASEVFQQCPKENEKGCWLPCLE